jgi:hypothetical protein
LHPVQAGIYGNNSNKRGIWLETRLSDKKRGSRSMKRAFRRVPTGTRIQPMRFRAKKST